VTALRALLTGIVDYAGLFPPASLDMPTAVSNFRSYENDPSSWMLGRFVVPVARLGELRDAVAAMPVGPRQPMRLTVVLGTDVENDVATVRAFTSAHGRSFAADMLEAKFATASSIERAAAVVGSEFELFAELPIDSDPHALIQAVTRSGISAKVRTGGVTLDAFPLAANVVRFMRRCLDAGVRFKATAGLHHPLRAEYPLTYEQTSPRGVMFGYLNVFLAAAFMSDGMRDTDAERLLDERDPTSFSIGEDHIEWREHAVSAERLAEMRAHGATSFGSCSFREPADELYALSIRN